ncbi:hypothetical protein NHQ30_008035 [Ciborinia camelliae]|nr:hypothetical protein NHQ30_008035 [Ciborinia camelliae]
MGTRLMTLEAARHIARAHPDSGFARRSTRAGHSNSQRDAQSQATQDRELQTHNRDGGAASDNGHNQVDRASTHDGQEQAAEDQCPSCTSDNLCARHANRWAW